MIDGATYPCSSKPLSVQLEVDFLVSGAAFQTMVLAWLGKRVFGQASFFICGTDPSGQAQLALLLIAAYFLYLCLVIMGPHNQNFQEYSFHGAPWTMTFTRNCLTLAAERIRAMPQSSRFHSLVSPWPTRSGSPVWFLPNVLTSVHFRLTCLLLQFLGFSVGQPKLSWGGECSSLCGTVPASRGRPHLWPLGTTC